MGVGVGEGKRTVGVGDGVRVDDNVGDGVLLGGVEESCFVAARPGSHVEEG